MSNIDDLIGRIYAAAEDDAAWPSFLSAFADAVGGQQTVIIFQDAVEQAGTLGATVRVDPYWMELYNSHYASENFFLTATAPFIKTGAITASHWFFEDAQIEKTGYYNEYLRPQDIFHSADCVMYSDEKASANLITMRARGAGAFESQELGIMRALMPHLQRAYRIHRKLTAAATTRELFSSAMDMLTTGIILLEATGRVIHASQSARRMLDRGDGLVMSGDRFSSRDQKEVLESVYRSAARGEGVSTVISVSRGGSARPYVLTIVPAASVYPNLSGVSLRLIVFIDDPDDRPADSRSLLRQLYGLTNAEANIALHLMAGHTLREIAARTRVGEETVRSHLKELLAKTGTRRQAELLLLLERVAGRHTRTFS